MEDAATAGWHEPTSGLTAGEAAEAAAAGCHTPTAELSVGKAAEAAAVIDGDRGDVTEVGIPMIGMVNGVDDIDCSTSCKKS
jgi:hypothetical protein